MQFNDRQRRILVGVFQDQRRLAAMNFRGGDSLEYMARGNYRLQITRARQGYVPIDLAAWLGGPPTNSETVMFCREYERLEDMALLERCNFSGGRRTTHLRLTDEGHRAAEELLDESGDTDEGAIDWSKVEFLPIELPVDASEGDDCADR